MSPTLTADQDPDGPAVGVVLLPEAPEIPVCQTVDGASAFSYPIIFLPFISSALVATATMPGPVRAFAEHQPVTPIVDAVRDLYAQQPVSTDLWIALAWCSGILVVGYALAMATYRRRNA